METKHLNRSGLDGVLLSWAQVAFCTLYLILLRQDISRTAHTMTRFVERIVQAKNALDLRLETTGMRALANV